MAANGQRDDVNWDLDWDDLTGGASPPPVSQSPTGTAASGPPTSQAARPGGPPPLPQRAFPSPSGLFADAEPAPILPVQRLSESTATAAPRAAAASPAAVGGQVRSLTRGQRMKLADVLPGNPPPGFEAVLTVSPAVGQTLDLCCFGLDEAGKLSDDRYFVFYNQKRSPEGALEIRGGQGHVFGVNLAQLSGTIRRLVFTANVDGAGSVRTLGASRFELRVAGGRSLVQYAFSGGELEEVKALMVAEIYYKDGWRLAAVGQGFAGGLSELLRHFGGQEI